MKASLVYPLHYRVAQREGNTWHFRKLSVFYNPSSVPIVDPNDISSYGTSWRKLAIELFKINGGKPGFYLADLRNRKYWYCGDDEASVRARFHELGIGCSEPM